MDIRPIDGGWELLAPAKLNLFFEVLARRADGYHEIESLMAPVSLYDTVRCLSAPEGQLSLTCDWAPGLKATHGAPTVDAPALLEEMPPAERNLAYRAAKLLRERSGVALGVALEVVKRIPSAAGLGGGSSDAAAVLLGCNRLWGLGWSTRQLAEVAAELGSDVPFFLYGSAAICRGRGELVEPIDGLGAWNVVVVRPPAGLSTAAVYGACQPATEPAQVEPLVEQLRSGLPLGLERLLVNRLTEPAAQLSPWVARLLKTLAATPCWGHGMSGSGTACYAFYPSALVARQVARSLESQGFGYAVAARIDGLANQIEVPELEAQSV